MSAAVPDEKAPNVVAESSCSSTAYTTPDNERQEAPGDEPEAPPRDISGWKWWLVMASILSSIFFYALDNTVVADIQPVIIGDLGELEKLTWLSVAFLLGATATNLIWGKVYSQFNAKWTYILNVAVFEIGSAVCGAAPSMNVMIVGRALCGVAGAGLYVGVMTLIAMTTSLPERPLYVGGTGLTWGRLFSVLSLEEDSQGSATRGRTEGAFSRGGHCWSGTADGSFDNLHPRHLMGGVVYPWNSGQVIGLFVASGVLFIVLGSQQVFLVFTTIERRIIPVELFGSRTVLILFASTAAAGASAFVPIYMIPLYFQFTRGDAALDAGVRLLPFIILMVATILTNGAFLSKFGYYMPWYTAGGLLALTGGALMYTVDLNTSTSRIYGYTVILGLGVGLWIQASFAVAQAVVEPKYVPAAVGFITLAQFAGITIVMAIANTIFLNEYLSSIPRILPNVPREEIEAAIQGTSDLLDRLSSDVRTRVLEAIVSGISKSYALVIASGALVAVLSLLMKHERLFNVSAAVGAA
ncbi:putative HC-toxin efflux carrier TOXA [Aspergillus udagawae]|nr:putative HC-toxin efflux carrier TOXA [Aspergillus udagawae]